MMDLEKVLDSVPMVESVAPESPQPLSGEPSVQEAEPVVEQPKEETPADRNFKALRELRAKAEQERDQALRRAAELEARYASHPFKDQSQDAQEEYQEIGIGNDDIAEGKHVKQVSSEVKKLRAELRQYKEQSVASLVEARLKMEYPDIEKVVTKENIEILGIQEPDIAATINDSQDLYKKAVAAYKLIKKFGIQPEDNYQEDRIRAQVNAAKPRPLASVSPQQGDSPLSHANAFANGLTDELRAQLLKEMMNARR